MHRDRAMAVALAGLVAAIVLAVLYQRGPDGVAWFPACSFHRLTGLHCPGCGMTRAVHATLHGRIGEAFRFNPLGMILVPVLLIWLGLRIPGWIRGAPPEPGAKPAAILGWWALGLVLVFWVARNIPVWPFVSLAPP